MVERAGASIVAVHGRTREQKCAKLVRADWDAIKAVKDALQVRFTQSSFFQNCIYLFQDTLILQIMFLIIKINNFRGDLSDISAKSATLVSPCVTSSANALLYYR